MTFWLVTRISQATIFFVQQISVLGNFTKLAPIGIQLLSPAWHCNSARPKRAEHARAWRFLSLRHSFKQILPPELARSLLCLPLTTYLAVGLVSRNYKLSSAMKLAHVHRKSQGHCWAKLMFPKHMLGSGKPAGHILMISWETGLSLGICIRATRVPL